MSPLEQAMADRTAERTLMQDARDRGDHEAYLRHLAAVRAAAARIKRELRARGR